MIFVELNFRRLFAGNFIRVIGGVLKIAPTARLRKCKIYVHPGAELIIGNNVLVEYADSL